MSDKEVLALSKIQVYAEDTKFCGESCPYTCAGVYCSKYKMETAHRERVWNCVNDEESLESKVIDAYEKKHFPNCTSCEEFNYCIGLNAALRKVAECKSRSCKTCGIGKHACYDWEKEFILALTENMSKEDYKTDTIFGQLVEELETTKYSSPEREAIEKKILALRSIENWEYVEKRYGSILGYNEYSYYCNCEKWQPLKTTNAE